MSSDECLLRIEGLDKRFSATHANKNISLTLSRGEVRGLAGENGSGKSTLLSQIAGIYRSDAGRMYINGKEYAPQSPLDANDRGIAMVMQELGLVNALPAGINVYLGKTKQFSRFGFVNLKKIYQAANAEAKKVGSRRDAATEHGGRHECRDPQGRGTHTRPFVGSPAFDFRRGDTSPLPRQPTAVICPNQAIQRDGPSAIMISHDLEELMELTDTISILRDGELIETVSSREIEIGDLKTKMVGRKLDEEYYRQDQQARFEDEVRLSVRGVSTAQELSDINFDVHKGEILGFCGLSDSGIHEIGKAIYGLTKLQTGMVELCGTGKTIRRQTDALLGRMAYVPKDRDSDALMMSTTIANNFIMPSVEEKQGVLGYLDEKQLNAVAKQGVESFQVKCVDIHQSIGELSGGNKQKINLGRWLIKDLQVLVVDCPTRGVDVGVKAYLYQRLREAKDAGLAIVMITDELTEAIGMCDNIIVMKNGRIKKQFTRGEQFNEEKIIEVMV